MTLPLVEFLLARIVEDENVAMAATLGPWDWDPHGDLVTVQELPAPGSSEDLPGSVLWAGGYDATDPTIEGHRADRAHIARWDPTRVLAGCRARRSVVLMLAPLVAECAECASCTSCHSLRLLALPHADHSAHRREWRLNRDTGTG